MWQEQYPVVVGVDGTEASALAVRWAVREAVARHRRLRVVHAYSWPPALGPVPMYTELPEYDPKEVRLAAERVVDDSVRLARELADDRIEVTGGAVEGHRVSVLLTESAQAEVVVVGSRRLHAVGSAMLGSVGAGLTARAAGPTVVVRGPAGEAAEGTSVIAGVDGGERSATVLRYAFEHASRHRVGVRAVLCRHPRMVGPARWTAAAAEQARVRAASWLAEVLAGWEQKYPDVPVSRALLDDHPVSGLVAESAAQQLLVVGGHRRHAVAGSLLGSVSQGVLHHADCPVAVVPTGD
ncbi:MAG: universal stress protein [Actinobacteria bacterium]|nr:universal stress protein [Actinomycetota bacterium]